MNFACYMYIYLLQVNSVKYIHIFIHRYDQANVRVIFKPLFNQIVWLDWLQLKCPCSMDKEILNIYSQNSIIGRHANYMMTWSMNWKQLLGRLTNSMRREPTKPMRLIQIFLNVLYPFKSIIPSINWFWNTEFWDPTFKWIFISAAPYSTSKFHMKMEILFVIFVISILWYLLDEKNRNIWASGREKYSVVKDDDNPRNRQNERSLSIRYFIDTKNCSHHNKYSIGTSTITWYLHLCRYINPVPKNSNIFL